MKSSREVSSTVDCDYVFSNLLVADSRAINTGGVMHDTIMLSCYLFSKISKSSTLKSRVYGVCSTQTELIMNSFSPRNSANASVDCMLKIKEVLDQFHASRTDGKSVNSISGVLQLRNTPLIRNQGVIRGGFLKFLPLFLRVFVKKPYLELQIGE